MSHKVTLWKMPAFTDNASIVVKASFAVNAGVFRVGRCPTPRQAVRRLHPRTAPEFSQAKITDAEKKKA